MYVSVRLKAKTNNFVNIITTTLATFPEHCGFLGTFPLIFGIFFYSWSTLVIGGQMIMTIQSEHMELVMWSPSRTRSCLIYPYDCCDQRYRDAFFVQCAFLVHLFTSKSLILLLIKVRFSGLLTSKFIKVSHSHSHSLTYGRVLGLYQELSGFLSQFICVFLSRHVPVKAVIRRLDN